MFKSNVRSLVFLVCVVVAVVGCGGVDKARAALTWGEDQTAKSADEQQVDEGMGQSAQESKSDEPPFAVSTEAKFVQNGRSFEGINIVATSDEVTIISIVANRGNCGVSLTTFEVENYTAVAAYPVTLKFGDTWSPQFKCGLDSSKVIEMQINTTVGSWIWKRQ